MNTQRVNTYITGSTAIFYIEQYNEAVHDWFVVGDTYTKLEHASVAVELYNTKLIFNKLRELEAV